jgi:hypothetical protein
MSGFKIKKLFVIRYSYELSIKDSYKQKHPQWNKTFKEIIVDEIVLNDRKYISLVLARKHCRAQFRDIIAVKLDLRDFILEDMLCLGDSIEEEEDAVWEWVDEQASWNGDGSLSAYSASEEYYDNCWKWSAYVSIELSGEYSKFYVRNILLCFRNSGLSQVVQMSILCYLGIMNKDFQLIEGAIEPY